jgi:hypothetical protein
VEDDGLAKIPVRGTGGAVNPLRHIGGMVSEIVTGSAIENTYMVLSRAVGVSGTAANVLGKVK